MRLTDALGATIDINATWFDGPCLCVEIDDGQEIVNAHLPLAEAKVMMLALARSIALAEGRRPVDVYEPVVCVQ